MNVRRLSRIIAVVGAIAFFAACSSDETEPGEQNQQEQDAGDVGEEPDITEPDPDADAGEEEEESCNPVYDEDCPCKAGQFKLCLSDGDPADLPPNSQCVPGFQECVDGEWSDECIGEHIPGDGDCSPPSTPEECDGFINEYGECVEGPTGEPADENVFCAGGDTDEIGDYCSCEVPEGGEEYARQNQPCYTGPAETLGVGQCQAGTRDCQGDGTWGPCEGQVLPAEEETCGDGLDNTCTGIIDDGCPELCPPGVENCDSFEDGYLDEPCPDGSPRNDCGGCEEVADEHVCGDGLDNTCDGRSGDVGCPCTDGSQPCYPGPHEVAGVGECAMGVQYCEGETWGECQDYVLPTPEQCGTDGMGNGLDNNCSGIVDEGCGCTDGDTRPCGTNIGACEQGTQTCEDGEWGECEDAIGPEPEVCDGVDNSCNGIVDDDLRNACGQCEGPCYTYETTPGDMGGDIEEGLEFIDGDDPDNASGKDGVTLSEASTFPSYLWAANSGGSGYTVSKVDTTTGEEVGRYWVGANPSRTAVDLDGNMWVVGRNDGRVTKVLWNHTDCDPNLPTSEPDADGNVDTVNDAADPLADGCVVYSDTPGASDGYTSGRGVAVDASGQVWIGYSDSGGAVQRINPSDFDDISQTYPTENIPVYEDANGDGMVTETPGVNADPGRVYGLVADSQGYLWMADLWDSDGLPRFNTNTNEWDMNVRGFNCAIYGIAIDGDDRVWMGCGNPGWADTHSPTGDGIAMFDPNTERIHRFHVPDQFSGQLPPRGTSAQVQTDCTSGCAGWETTAIAVEPETGDVWATSRNNGYLLRMEFDENDPSQSTWRFIPVMRDDNGDWLPEATGGGDMRGVGFDNDGYAWHLGMATTWIFRVHPGTEEVESTHNIGTHGHYTYSDFTGASAFNFTAPRGIWRYVFSSEIPNTEVDGIDVEATVPDTTTLGVRIRALDGNDNPIGDWYPAPSGASAEYFDYPTNEDEHSFDFHDLIGGSLTGDSFEVEVRMTRTDNDVRPYLHNLDLQWHWP